MSNLAEVEFMVPYDFGTEPMTKIRCGHKQAEDLTAELVDAGFVIIRNAKTDLTRYIPLSQIKSFVRADTPARKRK